MRNYKFLALFLVIGVLLSGCGAGDDLPETPELDIPSISKSPEPINSREPVASATQVPQITDIPELDNSITIYLINSIIEKYDADMAEYMAGLMKEKGFEIEVKFFDMYQDTYQSREAISAKYEEILRKEIESGKNLVFEVMLDINEMDTDGLLYYHDENSDDPIFYTGGKKRPLFTGVYIRKTLEEQYGEPIGNIDDYRKFLDWAAENAGGLKPVLVQMHSGTESFTPISLFAQEAGFVRADFASGAMAESQTTIYMELSDIAFSKEIVPVVYEAAQLPFFEKMDRVLDEWYKKGYIDVIDQGDDVVFDNYASVILNVRDTSEYYSHDYNHYWWGLRDASDFNLHIFFGETGHLDNPLAGSYVPSGQFAISAYSQTPQIITEFFDWVYGTIENYMWFMCGREGIDYTYNEGRLEFLENENGFKYGEWYKHTVFVESDAQLAMAHFPANWEEVAREFEDMNKISMKRVIGNENIAIDLDALVYETVFEKELQNAYWKEIKLMYDMYFDNFKFGSIDFPIEKLRKSLLESETAVKKMKAYETFLKAMCGE